MCPSTNTRWCPTPEQLMILEELYRRGLRTPNATQIQKIAAHLSLYGNIQGKNVFYWFQNHKARDRQKLRKKLHHHLLHRHHLHRHPHSQFLDFQFPPLFSAPNLPFQGGDVGVMGQTWIGSDTPEDCLIRSYGHDSPTTMEVGPTWGSKPLQTLELFPLTSPSATSNDQETLSGSSSM